MTRSRPVLWILNLGTGIRRCVAQIGRLMVSPDRHVTLVIARAANQARRRPMIDAVGHVSSRTVR